MPSATAAFARPASRSLPRPRRRSRCSHHVRGAAPVRTPVRRWWCRPSRAGWRWRRGRFVRVRGAPAYRPRSAVRSGPGRRGSRTGRCPPAPGGRGPAPGVLHPRSGLGRGLVLHGNGCGCERPVCNTSAALACAAGRYRPDAARQAPGVDRNLALLAGAMQGAAKPRRRSRVRAVSARGPSRCTWPASTRAVCPGPRMVSGFAGIFIHLRNRSQLAISHSRQVLAPAYAFQNIPHRPCIPAVCAVDIALP